MDTGKKSKYMKLLKSLTVFACAFAFVASVALADDAKADKKDSKSLPTCCRKAKKLGKECDHQCCVDAKKDGKICDKCPQPKKKADAAAESK